MLFRTRMHGCDGCSIVCTELAADGLKGRIFETNLADLNNEEEHGFRKIKLSCEDVQGKNCLTDFHGKVKNVNGFV